MGHFVLFVLTYKQEAMPEATYHGVNLGLDVAGCYVLIGRGRLVERLGLADKDLGPAVRLIEREVMGLVRPPTCGPHGVR